jgi:sugar lactone lactonase YvrE
MNFERRTAKVFTAALLVGFATAKAQVHQGTPYLRRLDPPIAGDEFRVPRAVHADPHSGEVFVCDTFNNRIAIFDHRGFFRYQITGGSEFRAPLDVAVDDKGFIFSLARHRGYSGIALLDFDGKLVEPIELEGLPDGISEPNLKSIAVSTAGDRLYALDSDNQRLWIANRSGEVLSSVDFTTGLTEEEIEDQLLGHVDVYGNTVLVAVPSAGQIELFDLDGRPRAKIGFKGTAPCQLGFPVAAALDADGKVWVLDNQRALFMRWDPENNKCLAEYSGFGNVPGALYRPSDLSLDDSGNLYVSQGYEGRVQVFRADTTAPPLLEVLQLVPQGASR